MPRDPVSPWLWIIYTTTSLPPYSVGQRKSQGQSRFKGVGTNSTSWQEKWQIHKAKWCRHREAWFIQDHHHHNLLTKTYMVIMLHKYKNTHLFIDICICWYCQGWSSLAAPSPPYVSLSVCIVELWSLNNKVWSCYWFWQISLKANADTLPHQLCHHLALLCAHMAQWLSILSFIKVWKHRFKSQIH